MGVLIVEDDTSIREVLADALGDEGFEVHTAADGVDGLTAIRALPRPLLVLLDLMMPRMTGQEVLAALTAADRAELGVLVVSATDEPLPDDARAWILGRLRKPLDLDVLLRALREFSRGR